MAKYYATLGQSHIHEIDGKKWDKDGLLEFEAKNLEKVDEYLFKNFGHKWGTVLIEAELETALQHFPKGIIATVKI